MTDVVVHRELVFDFALVWKHVNHPGKNFGEKGSALSHAGRAGMDGSEHAELRVLTKVLFHFVCRGAAEVYVLVPARHTEGNSPVQLILGGTWAGGEHDAFEYEALLRGAVIEQRSGASRIEDGVGVFRVGVVGEMKLGLVNGWIGLDVAVGDGLLVVLVLFDCGPDLVDDGFGAGLVAWQFITGGSYTHVVSHGLHALAHHGHAFHGVHHGIAGITGEVSGVDGFDSGAWLLSGGLEREWREYAETCATGQKGYRERAVEGRADQ